MGDHAEVITGPVADTLGQRHLDVPDRAMRRRAVGRGRDELAVGHDAHRLGRERVEERADLVARQHLDAEARADSRLGELDAERLGQLGPEAPLPAGEVGVEVAARVALAAAADAGRSQLGEARVDQLRELLERGLPVAVPAAEHGIPDVLLRG